MPHSQQKNIELFRNAAKTSLQDKLQRITTIHFKAEVFADQGTDLISI